MTLTTRSPPPASSRGARASSPVTRPAGRPPTGSRTSCSATTGPEVYDEWVTHKIPFNDPRSSRRRQGRRDPQERQVRQRRLRRRRSRSPAPPSRRAACRSSRASAPCTGRRPSTPTSGPRAPRWPRTATCSRSTCRRNDPAEASRCSAPASSSAAFTDRPEVQAVQPTSPARSSANSRPHEAGDTSPRNKGLDPATPRTRSTSSRGDAQDPNTVFRFDGSDLMPAAVGAGTFWTGMTDWINGKDTKTVLDYIEASWPKS